MADNWRFVLYRDIEDPNKIVLSSSQAVVIKDAFPKAKNHYLVIPKNVKIKDVFQLSRVHLPLLDDMFQLAKKLIDSLKMQPKEFLIGFKLDPSMNLLNLHVISTDFNSKHMKRDYHWTNFHTKIFLPYNAAYDQLKNKGHIDHLTEDELNEARSAPWKCHRCDFQSNTWFVLKYHLPKHWEEKQISCVEQQHQKKQGNVTSTNESKTTHRSHETAPQQNVTKELPQTGSNIKPQPSLKERLEALSKMLGTTTNSNTNTTPETVEHRETVCEQQQNETTASPQINTNAKPQPPLADRLQALSNRLEILSLTTTESKPTTSVTTTTLQPISDCNVQIDHKIGKPDLNKYLGCDPVTLEHNEYVCKQQQEQQTEPFNSSPESNYYSQSYLKAKFEELSKLLKIDSVKETPTSDTTKITGLKVDDQDTLAKEGKNTENIYNCNAQPSLQERLAALTKILEEGCANE